MNYMRHDLRLMSAYYVHLLGTMNDVDSAVLHVHEHRLVLLCLVKLVIFMDDLEAAAKARIANFRTLVVEAAISLPPHPIHLDPRLDSLQPNDQTPLQLLPTQFREEHVVAFGAVHAVMNLTVASDMLPTRLWLPVQLPNLPEPANVEQWKL
jgi:hypothetical protein